MITAPKLTITEVDCCERSVTLRLPFCYGMVTLLTAPQAFIRVRIRTEDGREAWGQAAEVMAPKWFDKSPDLSNEANFDQLRRTLALYGEALSVNGAHTAFGHYASLYKAHIDAAGLEGLNPLVAGFGPALLDRAVFDALCHAHDFSMADGLCANLAGMRPGDLVTGFEGFNFDGFLAAHEPLSTVHARHTVGFVDPLTTADQSAEDRVGDGLPETLEEIIATYGVTYFKIKVAGNLANDVARLINIAAILDQTDAPYHLSIDGNEQYEDADAGLALLAAMRAAPELQRLCNSILFVEQPIQRTEALSRDMAMLAKTFPVIIDESDADLDAFPRARAQGYTGVSSKNCKGFYKSLINQARCQIWSAEDGQRYFMTGEDLICQAGLGVQQDLALVSFLGINHVERNGHHYVHGMAGVPEDEQSAFIEAHPDVYMRHNGQVCVKIEAGRISTKSLQCAGFGSRVSPVWDAMSEMC